MSDGYHLQAHVFVCTNQKEKGDCCAPRGGVELRNELKKRCQDPVRGWHGKVRINASGCLGRCAEGVAAVIYPEGRWMTRLKVSDADAVMEAIAETLERLEQPGE